MGYFYNILIDFIVKQGFRQPELVSGSHKNEIGFRN